MNPFEMVVLIVAIVMIASVLRARYGHTRRRRHGEGELPADNGEARLLREEVARLKERVQTLERITVEKENSLAREIEDLRTRP